MVINRIFAYNGRNFLLGISMASVSKVPCNTAEQFIVPNESDGVINDVCMAALVVGSGSNRLNNILALFVKCQGCVKPFKLPPVVIAQSLPARIPSAPKKRQPNSLMNKDLMKQIYANSIAVFLVLYFQNRMMAINLENFKGVI